MSGFSAEWLQLREPADHRARSRELAQAAAELVRCSAPARILDLGCGTGSNIRALAPLFTADQHWALVDHDRGLLAAARESLAAWADRVECDSPLTLLKGGRRLTVSTVEADLAYTPITVQGADLVTTSALLDLVSSVWLEDFGRALAAARVPFLAALTYDGTADWDPAHPLDPSMRDALAAHQRRDKGFGPALGPLAAERAAAILSGLGFRVERRRTPWILAADEAALQQAVAEGYGQAARETATVADSEVTDWLRFRTVAALELRSRTIIGHEDLLAVPIRA